MAGDSCRRPSRVSAVIRRLAASATAERGGVTIVNAASERSASDRRPPRPPRRRRRLRMQPPPPIRGACTCHVIVVSLIGGFGVLLWFVLYEWLNKLIWDGSFVTDNAWMFPVICLPFSLLVGLLVKYAKAPSNLDGSILDSLTGDVSHLRWRDLPATVATSLASLFSGAVLGPEGAIGNIASKIAALYCDLFRVPADRRPKLVFASVASGYNGLLENPVFAAVLGTGGRGDQEAGPLDPPGQPHRRRRRLRRLPAAARDRVRELPAPPAGAGLHHLGRLPHGAAGARRARPGPPHRRFHEGLGRLLRPAQGPDSPAGAGRRRDLQPGGRLRPGGHVLRRDPGQDGHRRRGRLRHRAAAGDGRRQARTAQRGVQERVPRRADVPAHLRLDQRRARAQHRVPGRAGGDLRRRHHDRRRLRAVPDPADGGPPHGVHAGPRTDDGGAHRAGHRHRDDRHAAAANAHHRAAGWEEGKKASPEA